MPISLTRSNPTSRFGKRDTTCIIGSRVPATLDNGIRVDVIIQLETDQKEANGNGNSVDESYLKVGNLKQWGEFRMGSTKQAHFVLGRTVAPSVNTINAAVNNDTADRFVPSTTGTKFFNHEGGADRMLAMYVTPNLNGFQGGISYTPAYANNDNPANTKKVMGTAGDSEDVSLGANYKGKFGDASVQLSGGYTKRSGATEWTTTQFGGSVGFAGFSFGGMWAERKDDKAMSDANDIEGFMAGVGYKTSPWSVALTWLNTTDDASDVMGEDESNQYTLGMAYSSYDGCPAGIGFPAILKAGKSSKTQPFFSVS